VPRMTVMGTTKFERFFRIAASLDVDKQDLKRYSDFVNHQMDGPLIRGQATAKANGRDIIEPTTFRSRKACGNAFTRSQRARARLS
jgi:hypothetical protein